MSILRDIGHRGGWATEGQGDEGPPLCRRCPCPPHPARSPDAVPGHQLAVMRQLAREEALPPRQEEVGEVAGAGPDLQGAARPRLAGV